MEHAKIKIAIAELVLDRFPEIRSDRFFDQDITNGAEHHNVPTDTARPHLRKSLAWIWVKQDMKIHASHRQNQDSTSSSGDTRSTDSAELAMSARDTTTASPGAEGTALSGPS